MILVCHWFRERVHYFCSIFLLIFLLTKLVIHYVWNPGRPATLLKKRLWSRCFPVNFVKFLRTPFLTEHLWWLLLKSKSKLRTMCRKNHENFKNSKLGCNLTGSYKKEYIHRHFYIQLSFCIWRHFYIERLFLYYRTFLHSFISWYSGWKKWIKGLFMKVLVQFKKMFCIKVITW